MNSFDVENWLNSLYWFSCLEETVMPVSTLLVFVMCRCRNNIQKIYNCNVLSKAMPGKLWSGTGPTKNNWWRMLCGAIIDTRKCIFWAESHNSTYTVSLTKPSSKCSPSWASLLRQKTCCCSSCLRVCYWLCGNVLIWYFWWGLGF